MGSILFICGPVGAGKTTVARELVGLAAAATAYIEGDVFLSFVAKSPPERPRHQNYQAAMRAMTRAASAFAAGGLDVILDFSMPSMFVRAAGQRMRCETHHVILRPTMQTCAARAAARPYGTITDYGPYAGFYDLFDAEPRHIIRNDTEPANAIAAAILAGLAAGRFRMADGAQGARP